jgi:hypothetical protein
VLTTVSDSASTLFFEIDGGNLTLHWLILVFELAYRLVAFELTSISLHIKMATGTYPRDSGYSYLHPPGLNLTRRVTRTRSHTRTRAGKFYPTGNPHVTAYPRITYKYQIFTCKNKSFQAAGKGGSGVKGLGFEGGFKSIYTSSV